LAVSATVHTEPFTLVQPVQAENMLSTGTVGVRVTTVP
jgi:hypothetical protein